MKLKMGKLTPDQHKHLLEHGWVQLPSQLTPLPAFKPADSPRAAVGRRNGRKAANNKIVRNKFGGR